MADALETSQVASVVQAFAQAIEQRDEGAAQALSSEAGWAAKGNTGRRLFRHLAGDGLQLAPLGELRAGTAGRAAASCTIFRPEDGRNLGTIWVHLVDRSSGDWAVEGTSQSILQTSAYLAGAVPAVFSLEDLAPSAEAEGVLSEAIGAVQGGDKASVPVTGAHGLGARAELAAFAEEAPSPLRVVRSVELASVGRAAVGVGFGEDPEVFGDLRWFILARPGEGEPYALHSHSFSLSVEKLLADLGA